MARIPHIEARLNRWAAWRTCGDGSGYPVKNPIHETWQPPSPGMTPTLKVSATTDAKQTEWAIEQLPPKLGATVFVHYLCRHWTPEEQGAAVGCQANTVSDRIDRAHRLLAGVLDLQNVGCNVPDQAPRL